MTACTGYIAFSGSDRWDRPCPGKAALVITAGCVHEHVGKHELCPAHVREADAGVLLCGDCLSTRTASHRCFLRVLTSAFAGDAP